MLFTLQQTLRDLVRHPVRTLTVSALIAVLMVAGGGIYAMSINVRYTISEIEGAHSINVYLLRGLDQTSIATLLEQMRKDKAVARAEYVSPEDGLASLKTQYPQFASILDDLTHNPIPPLVRIYPVSVDGIARLSSELRAMAGVQAVEYDEASVEGMINATTFVHQLLVYVLVLAAFLFVAGFCLMAVIVINGKRKETAVLSMVGASGAQILASTPMYLVLIWAIAVVLFASVLPTVINTSTSRLIASFPWITPQPVARVYVGSLAVILAASLICLFVSCLVATILAYRVNQEQGQEETLLE